MHARTEAASETAPAWPEEIFKILQRFDVRQVPYVPDAGHSQLIERVLGTSSMRGVPLTTEEEGVALLRAVLSAVSLVLVMRACRAVGVDQRQAAWLTLGAAALLLPSMTMRPQLFGVACFGGVLAILMDRSRHPGRLWLLIPLAALWSNLHGTFPLLFAMGGAVLLDDLRTGRGQWRQLVVVGLLALLGIAVLLFIDFQSVRLTLLIMLTLPFALIGGVAAAWLGGGVLSLGSVVGFITVLGIAARTLFSVSFWRMKDGDLL